MKDRERATAVRTKFGRKPTLGSTVKRVEARAQQNSKQQPSSYDFVCWRMSSNTTILQRANECRMASFEGFSPVGGTEHARGAEFVIKLSERNGLRFTAGKNRRWACFRGSLSSFDPLGHGKLDGTAFVLEVFEGTTTIRNYPVFLRPQ